jgi:DNA-binding NarL/FixJ family response regulator
MSVKLLVADHQEVMREGLKNLISRSVVKVVAEANTNREAMRMVQKHKPDVVILDVRFAGDDGFQTLNKLRRKWADLPILLWATSDNPTYVCRAMALKASGYLTRGTGRAELLAAIRTAASKGDAWTEEQINTFTGAPELPAKMNVHLTPREREVIRQLAYGLSNKEIAKALEVSFETIKEHIQHILRKLDFKDRTQIAVWAVRNGLE